MALQVWGDQPSPPWKEEQIMKTCRNLHPRQGPLWLIPVVLEFTGCASTGGGASPVAVVANQPNLVAYWNDIANKTVLAPSTISTTPEERTPTFFFDVASVHVAIYDAVVAIEGHYKPFTVKPKASAAGASTEAAVSAAAYGVLKQPFPHRSTQYHAACEQRLVTLCGERNKLAM